MASKGSYSVVFDPDTDPVFPPMPDAGEDIDFTDHKPHVYRVEAYVNAPAPARGVPNFARWDAEVVGLFRIDDDGGETDVPQHVWDHAVAELEAKVLEAVEEQYWDSGAP